MKKLLAVCLAVFVAPLAFAKADQLSEMLKEKAEKAALSANSIKSVIEVSFDVKTVFSVYDIVEKNDDHLILGYMLPGKTVAETNWNLDEAEDMEPVAIYEYQSEYDPTILVNQSSKDREGNYHEVIRNYNIKRKGCSMFLIDENWLIGSIECIGSETEGAVGYPNSILANTPYRITNKVVEGDLYFDHSTKNKAKAEGRFFKGPNFVLVYIGDTIAKELMAGKPKANIMFFKNNIFSLLADGKVANNFKIRTSRFASGAVRSRALKAGSYNDGVFKLDDNIVNLSATGGDPLFFADNFGAQYLVGFNAGRILSTVPDTGAYLIADYQGEAVNLFYDFHQEDYDFVKETILSKSADDWTRIKPHLILK